MSEQLLARLDVLNEDAKVLGNELWERGPEWHELANRVYSGAKQIWIASSILRTHLRSVEKAP